MNEYAKKMLELSNDMTQYALSPTQLVEFQLGLVREALEYFANANDLIKKEIKNLGIDPKTAKTEDILLLARSSDEFRGQPNGKYGIAGLERILCRNTTEGGKVFRSSGTGGKGPVLIYRSPEALEIGVINAMGYMRYITGIDLEGALVLSMIPKEATEFMAIGGLGIKGYEYFGAQIVYGMEVNPDIDPKEVPVIWHRLRPVERKIGQFLASPAKTKILFTSNAGLHGMLQNLNLKMYLGENGYVVIGGGNKGNPAFKTSNLRKLMKGRILVNGETAPLYDVLGLTESINILPTQANGEVLIPPPTMVYTILDMDTDMPMELVEGAEGEWVYFNPQTPDFPEVIRTGDQMKVVKVEGVPWTDFGLKHIQRITTQGEQIVGCG
ncbi:MAG: hypothetical protein ACFFC7_16070 [Candidatus Hermodarchaeota archaeon]